ncbi:MAG TPA: transporter [bacterium]|nr:transporter [bacterium]
MKNLILYLFIIFFIPSLVYSARPLSVDDAGTVDSGIYETEAGIGYSQDKEENGETEISLSIKQGLTERMDLGVSLPYVMTSPKDGNGESGMGDAELIAKFNLVKEGDKTPGFSVTLGIIMDTGEKNKGIGSGEIDYNFNSILSKELQFITLNGNLGYTAKAKTASFGIALEYPADERLNLVAELTGENKSDSPIECIIGTNFSARENLILDFGIGTGLNDYSSRLNVTGGLTLSF